MSKIEEMLKNEKVEWKKLGEVCVFSRGQSITKKDVKVGEIPVIAGGQKPAYYHNVSNRDGITIAVAGSGAYAGFVSYWTKPIFLSDAFSIEPNGMLNKRYLYHWLLSKQDKIYGLKRGCGIPHVYGDSLGELVIPIPPLKTQEKIVKTLDKFTEYVTELQAELQAELQYRTNQYEYYRNMLLSEEYLNKLSKKLLDVSEGGTNRLFCTTLGDIGKFTRGNGLQKSDFASHGKPVIHYGQIYTKYGFETNEVISFVSEELFEKLRKARQGDILMATTSENIEDVGKCVVWTGNEEIGFSGDMYSYRTTENPKYIAYYFQTAEFQKQKEKKVTGTKLIRIHGDDMEKFSIQLPPLSLQNKIVEILDKFQAILSESKGLLPKEIEERQKQYEYYREKLLTFDVESSMHARTQLIANSYFIILKEAANIVGVNLYSIKWKTLGDIGRFENGSGMPKTMFKDDGEVGAIHYGHIYTKYNMFIDKPVVSISTKDAEKLKKVNKGDLVIARTSENIDDVMKTVAYLGEKTVVAGGHSTIFRHKENPKYLSYVLNGADYAIKQKNKMARGVKVIELSTADMEKIEIPLPPLPVQEYIVSILDKFDTLVNDIKSGLPKEIEERQKQYEYYRERLLSFKRP